MLVKEVSDRINRIDRIFPAIRKIAGKNSAASRQVLPAAFCAGRRWSAAFFVRKADTNNPVDPVNPV
jgi:hypothetical protein